MDMEGVIVRNRYYRDEGSDYVCGRLAEELKLFGIKTNTCSVFDLLANDVFPEFAVFFDKDYTSARLLEKKGVRVFNPADSIRICDDKYATQAELYGVADFPKTVCSPLKYKASTEKDKSFFDRIGKDIGFPLIAKFCVGSLGAQVFLIGDRRELEKFHSEHEAEGRIIYQEYVAKSHGKDIRIYTVGGKAIACVARESSCSFKSNAQNGAVTSGFVPTVEHTAVAERISKHLKLDYAAVDFFRTDDPLVIEVNSNAYFKEAERACGVDIAAYYARHIVKEIGC